MDRSGSSTSSLRLRERKGERGMRRGSILFFLCYCCLALVASSASSVVMAEADGTATTSKEEPAVHIVYMERPEDVEPEAYHVRTLAAVLGSEEAAREALIYSYRTAASGFSAKLTPQQVAEISKLPGVLQVMPSRTLHLHSGTSELHV